MQSQIRAQTGVGTANPVVINTNVSPVNLGIVVVVTGTVTYTVNHTYDSPAGFSTWLPDAVLVSKTATAETSIAFPVTGIQLVVTAGTGTVTMTVVQAGIQ